MIEPWDPRTGTDFRYSCDCEDYRAVGTCLHILSVKGHHCGWHQMFDAEEMADPCRCPRCGKETVEIEYAPD
jgi:predicted Zn-ribbon and HTH transcriptional regulator